MDKKIKEIMDYVNPKLQQYCEAQNKDIRQVSETDIISYLADDDYQKPDDWQQLLDEILHMAIYTPPNYTEEKEVVYSGKLYMIVNKGQTDRIKPLFDIAEVYNIELTGDNISMGAFATSDEDILLVKNEEEARAFVCLTKYFKADTYAILELEAKDAIAIYSLIGAQFGFEENKYYKASMKTQYEFPTMENDRRKKLVLKKIYKLEDLYKKNN